MNSPRHPLSALLLCGLLLLIPNAPAQAGSATWNLNPTSGNWNTAANWTPATVPDDPADTATFAVSQTTGITVSTSVELNGMGFNPGASAYAISLTGGLNISGIGIVNNSGVTQNIACNVASSGDFGVINFTDNATSGEFVNYNVEGGPRNDYIGGQIWFYDHSSAGSSIFTTHGGQMTGASGSAIYFLDESTATHAAFISNGGAAGAAGGGLHFAHSSGLTESTVIVNGPTVSGGVAGSFFCSTTSPLVAVTITTDGSPVANTGGAATYMYYGSAQGCTFTANGGTASNGGGGYVQFFGTFDTGDSVLVINGGTNGGNGGQLLLNESSIVSGRAEVFGNGMLEINQHRAPGASVGSLEGDGIVTMGGLNLTIGSNSLSTTFSGILQGEAGSSLSKIGTGTLSLTSGNTYTGVTTISRGTLLVKNTTGSATGTGTVQVSGGTLGGRGIIAGPTTIGAGNGRGGFLQPGKGASNPTTLTIQNTLTFKSDSTYTWKVNTKKAKADKVIANGANIESGSQFDFNAVGNTKLTIGKIFPAISNTAATPISGTFANLADGSTVTVGVNKLQASYSGGDGNDLTLTVVP